MTLESWASNVAVALDILTLVATSVAFTLALVAARGFRGTPWGRVLAPLPVVFAAMTLSTAVSLHPATPPHGGWLSAGCWALAVAAIAASCWRFVSLTAELEVAA